MLRAVVDTNIFIAALLSEFESGASLQVLDAILNGIVGLVTSRQVLGELRTVSKLPRHLIRHGMSDASVDDFCELILSISEIVDAARSNTALNRARRHRRQISRSRPRRRRRLLRHQRPPPFTAA